MSNDQLEGFFEYYLDKKSESICMLVRLGASADLAEAWTASTLKGI